MEKSSFFNAILTGSTYDRVYTAEDFAKYFSSFIGNGVFPTPATNLQVVADGTMRVKLKPGKGWINGYFYDNTEDLVLNVDVADGVLSRVDRVVIRLDFLNRQIKAYVKKGTPATYPLPVAPPLTRNNEIYELGLTNISINKGVTGIVQADITDLRANTSLCGYVAGVVQQIDTTELFTQFQSAFDVWFAQIKGQLSTDAAGNLQNQINDMRVGGKNILRNTALIDSSFFSFQVGTSIDTTFLCDGINTVKYSATNETSDTWISATPANQNVFEGRAYSVSAEVYLPAGHSIDYMASLQIQWFDSSGARISQFYQPIDKTIINKWQRLVIENKIAPAGAVTANARVYLQRNGKLWMAKLNLQEGTKITGWSPSPEDYMYLGSYNSDANGWNTLSNGEIEQWGEVEMSLDIGSSSLASIQFPTPFKSKCISIFTTVDYDVTSGSSAAIAGVIANGSTLKDANSNKSGGQIQLASLGSIGGTGWASGTRRFKVKWRAIGF